MFKAKILLFLGILIASQAPLAWAGSTTSSQSFKLSVTIPVVVGVNDGSAQGTISSLSRAKTTRIVQEQRAIRGTAEVLLKSIVVL